MRAQEFIAENTIKLSPQQRAYDWIQKVYAQYPQTWQNNHVMPMGGSGEDQQFAMFELTPSNSRRDAVEVKWFQAYPLRAGVGTRAMKELQRLAQADDIALTLYPWAKGQVSQAKLMKFYRGQGFRPINQGGKNMTWDPVAEGENNAMVNTASRLANKDDGKVAKLRAAGDKRREDQLKGRDIARRDRTSKDEWGYLKQGVAEAPLADYQPIGDFDKPGPFRGADKKLIPHPVNQLKAQRFFEKTPYNFRLFFSNIPGTGKYSEYGIMDPDTVKIIFGDAGEQIVAGHEDAITVVYVGNLGDSKVMLTPWMMAHRLGHAIQVGARGQMRNQQQPWKAGEDHFFGQVNSMLEEYYGKSGQPGGNLKAELTPEYNALFNAMGTQRSSRSGEIRRPYEFLYEIFAQYLGTGTVTFNALPANLGYGRRVWGNPSRYLNIKPEYRDETVRKQAAEVLSYDMELMFNDALSNVEGKILVM